MLGPPALTKMGADCGFIAFIVVITGTGVVVVFGVFPCRRRRRPLVFLVVVVVVVVVFLFFLGFFVLGFFVVVVVVSCAVVAVVVVVAMTGIKYSNPVHFFNGFGALQMNCRAAVQGASFHPGRPLLSRPVARQFSFIVKSLGSPAAKRHSNPSQTPSS